ncbi:MAG: RNA 2',3'-cyclic phosphodiesterase [Candidatus Latescibacteria bacterium]|nr:RNA 2',3'-cyclic phosphodiesterase [Candidatus Latescibacterota bacterium]
MKPATLRTFIAIALPEAVQDKVDALLSDLRKADAAVRWVPAQNLHLTLKFLGDVEEARLPDLYAGIRKATEGIEPFRITLTGLGAFPNPRRPRVLWIGLDVPEAMKTLYCNLEEELSCLHFPREKRKFSPHLTIGRVKAERGMEHLMSVVERTEFGPETISVARIVALKSELRPAGAVYSALEEFALGS